MRKRASIGAAAVVIALLVSVESVRAQYELKEAFPQLTLADPVDLQAAPDGTNRLFAVELDGRIKVFDNDSTVTHADLILDLVGHVDRTADGGLYGLAFHPDFANNGLFFINYTVADPMRKVISRFRLEEGSPPSVDRESETILLEIPIDAGGHNGGQLAFGPDGYLYVATGDGNANTGDSFGHGQNRETLSGTIIRIDVDNEQDGLPYAIPDDNPFVGESPDVREEIYAYGFRNPWRMSFDAETGDLWVGDVGEATKEEVSLVQKGGNHGWNVMEGTHCFRPDEDCGRQELLAPVWDYDREAGRSITGGYVYRGSRLPELVGKYIYGDWSTGRVWALSYHGPDDVENEELLDTDFHIVSFGTDEDDELYVVTIWDGIYEIVPSSRSSTQKPDAFVLDVRSFPNPFTDLTTIEYTLPNTAFVEFDVYNLLGERVRTLVSESQTSGQQEVRWDGKNESGLLLPTGVYFYRISVGEHGSRSGPLIRIR